MPDATSQTPSPPAARQPSPGPRLLLQSGPLAGRYPAAATMVILFLVPFLGLSAALPALEPLISQQLHMSPQTLSLANGMANAGYAVGTVLAVQLAQRWPQRRLLIVYAALLVIGSVLAASATGAGMFIAGHVLQGLCTSLLLIAAAPPLFLGFPASKLRWTAVIFNLCIFGAVAAGPLVGGAQASFHGWRPLFWIVAGIAVAGLLMSLLTFQDAPPADRSAPRDLLAIGLAASGAVAAFWGASELLTHRFLDASAFVPLVVGLVLIVTLWVYQYRARNPLLTLRSLASTIPVTGIVLAICAAAASTSAIGLTAAVLPHLYAPLHLGLLYIPELGAAVLIAFVFGAVFDTRYIHYFALAGMIFLAAGILVIRSAIPPTAVLTLVGTGLIGVGIGASVTPALFLAGFSLHSRSIQRVFAILELLRAVAAFMIVPILAHFAITLTGFPTAAFGTALWICFGLAAGGALAGVGLYLLGRVRPPAPALQRWMGGEEPAWDSPPLLAAIRQAPSERAPAGRLAGAMADALAGGGRLATALTGHQPADGPHGRGDRPGPVLFAYDGSDPARAAIAEAGQQLPARRDALVVTVWRTFNVGFVPDPGLEFNAACAPEVREAAEQTAARGVSLAEAAGFRAEGMAVAGTPIWKVIADVADDREASLIVVGTRGHDGIGGLVAGSNASAVASHSRRPVLTVRYRPGAGVPAQRTSSQERSSESVRTNSLAGSIAGGFLRQAAGQDLEDVVEDVGWHVAAGGPFGPAHTDRVADPRVRVRDDLRVVVRVDVPGQLRAAHAARIAAGQALVVLPEQPGRDELGFPHHPVDPRPPGQQLEERPEGRPFHRPLAAVALLDRGPHRRPRVHADPADHGREDLGLGAVMRVEAAGRDPGPGADVRHRRPPVGPLAEQFLGGGEQPLRGWLGIPRSGSPSARISSHLTAAVISRQRSSHGEAIPLAGACCSPLVSAVTAPPCVVSVVSTGPCWTSTPLWMTPM
jgi:nucleotide-binding universal stress UspA family protein/MFS family permease